MQSGSSTTPYSTKVDSGSTMPAPASMCASSRRRRMKRSASARSTRVLTPMVRDDVVGDVPDDVPARCAQDRQHVGQVQLALGVVGAQPRERAAQRGGVEGVEAGVDLGDREDGGRRVARPRRRGRRCRRGRARRARRRSAAARATVSSVATARPSRCDETTSRSSSPRISGVSPETTSTSPSKSPSASMPQRTASPVPRASGWIAAIGVVAGSSARTSSASGGVTTTSREAPASRAASSTQPRIGRPQVVCRTFGSADRMRVPFPPAITMQASARAPLSMVTAAPPRILDSRVTGPAVNRSTRSRHARSGHVRHARRHRQRHHRARRRAGVRRRRQGRRADRPQRREPRARDREHPREPGRLHAARAGERGGRRRGGGEDPDVDEPRRRRSGAAGDRGGDPRHAAEGGAVRGARPHLPAADGAGDVERLAGQRGAREGRASRAGDRDALLVPAAADPAGRGVRQSARPRSTCWPGRATPCARPARSRR